MPSLKKPKETDGVYVPSNLAPDRFIFFCEDTADRKSTLHATALVVLVDY